MYARCNSRPSSCIGLQDDLLAQGSPGVGIQIHVFFSVGAVPVYTGSRG